MRTAPPVPAASSDAPLVALLRSHAYAMSGTAVPASAVPAAPVITNVERVASATAGSGNIVEWQGAPGAASYEVRRSTPGQRGRGPWRAPYPPRGPGRRGWTAGVLRGRTSGTGDRREPGAGSTGPASAAFQMKDLTLDDNAANFSLSYQHSSDVAIDTRTPSLYAGDAARMAFWAAEPYAYVVWQAAGPIQTVEALAYYSPPNDELPVPALHGRLDLDSACRPATCRSSSFRWGRATTLRRYIYTIDGVQSCCPARGTSRCPRREHGWHGGARRDPHHLRPTR